MTDVTQILQRIETGDARAAAELLPLVYEELRELAHRKLSREPGGQTLQGTALVHEAYARLVGPAGADQRWDNRRHFFAAAAEAMRRILIESARRKAARKHGGNMRRVDLQAASVAAELPPDDLLDLDQALAEFEAEDPDKAALVRLRFFGGLSEVEAAECLGISRPTASRNWAFARAWLLERLQNSENP